MIQAGDQAPDFIARNQNGEEVTLSSFRGAKNVLLVFYPFAFSNICTAELCVVRDDLATYQNDDVQVLGVSVDSMFALKAWAKQERYEFPLMTDFWPHGAISTQYGVFNDQAGMAIRGTFLIDKAGVIRFAEVNGPGEARDASVWQAELAKLAG